MKRFYFIICLLLCMALKLMAQGNVLTVNVKTAGTLSTLVADGQKYSTKKMKVSGFLNGTDVKFLRDMAGVSDSNDDTEGILEDIDLSEASIVSGGDAYLSYYSTDIWDDVVCKTEDNVFPDDFFHGTSVVRVVLPANITKIGDNAFQNCSKFTAVDIPSTVTEIGNNAFSGSGLTSVVVPASVTKMGTYCFWGCANMKSVTFNATVSSIPECTFSQTSIESITLSDAIAEIGIGAFQFCYSLKSVEGGDYVIKIKDYAFNQCKALEKFKMPSELESIGRQSFSNCSSLTSLSLPSTLTYIGKSAFINDASLASIDVDAANTEYKSEAGIVYTKDGTKLVCCPAGMQSDVVVLDNTESIEEQAFDNCAKIKNLTLPSSLKEIGNDAFNFSSSLSLIKCQAVEPPTMGWSGAFFGVPKATCKLVVPKGSKTKYQEANGWKEFTLIEEDGTSSINALDKVVVRERYDLNGNRLENMCRGIVIVKDANGKAVKVAVK